MVRLIKSIFLIVQILTLCVITVDAQRLYFSDGTNLKVVERDGSGESVYILGLNPRGLAIDQAANLMFYEVGNDLYRANFNTGNFPSPLTLYSNSSNDHICIDPANQYVFYAYTFDYDDPKIRLSNYTDNGVSSPYQLIIPNYVSALGIDEISEEIYYIDDVNNNISVSNYSGTSGNGLYTNAGFSSIELLIVDPIRGYIFFTINEQDINRAEISNIAGTITPIKTGTFKDLTYDRIRGNIYYSDGTQIGRIKYDGTGDISIRSGAISQSTLCFATELNPFVVTNTNDSGPGSLRSCIQNANAYPGTQTITFNLPSVNNVITLTSNMEVITDPVIIDGTTQTGYDFDAGALITVDGAGTYSNPINFAADGCTVKGLYLNKGNTGLINISGDNNLVDHCVIGDCNSNGIIVFGISNTIQNCRIGTNKSGSTANAASAASGRAGIFVYSGSTDITIENNHIIDYPVLIRATLGNSYIRSNLLGVSKDGLSALGTSDKGMYLSNSTNVFIGSVSPADFNVVSNMSQIGIELVQSNTITLQGNIIGASKDIDNVIPNNVGIQLNDCQNTLIGTPGAGANINYIVGNTIGINSINSNDRGDFNKNIFSCNATPIQLLSGANNTKAAPVMVDVCSSYAIISSTTGDFIELYMDTTSCGVSYQGNKLVGTGTVSGSVITIPLTGLNTGDRLIALATSSADGTSMFSASAVVPPKIVSVSSNYLNRYIDVTFSDPMWADAGMLTPLSTGSFSLTTNINSGNPALTVTLNALTKTNGNALTGGETVIRFNYTVTGQVIGSETIEIIPVANSVYGQGIPMNALDLIGPVSLLTSPTITGNTGIISNQYVDVTFSAGVWASHKMTTAISKSAFNFIYSTNGGNPAVTATLNSLSKPNNTPLTGGESTIRFHLTITGTATGGAGNETIEIKPLAGKVYPGGLELPTTETTGAMNLLPSPRILAGASLSNDNKQMEVTFSGNVFADAANTVEVNKDGFVLAFLKNSGNATNVSVSSVVKKSGFNNILIFNLSTEGYPSGVEQVYIKPVAGKVYVGSMLLQTDQRSTPVTLHAAPNITNPAADKTSNLCDGGITNITITSDLTLSSIKWTTTADGITGHSNGNQTSPDINQTLSLTGTVSGNVIYTITPVSNGVEGPPVQFKVTVYPKPSVIATPTTQTICNNSNTAIQLQSNVVGASFSWIVTSNPNITGATNDSFKSNIIQVLHNKDTTTSHSIIYNVTASANGCVGASQNVQVNVKPTFSATFVTSDHIICNETPSSILEVNMLDGSGPWKMVYKDTETTYDTVSISSTPYQFSVSPTKSLETYTIVSIHEKGEVFCPLNIKKGSVKVETMDAVSATLETGSVSICPTQSTVKIPIALTGKGSSGWSVKYKATNEAITTETETTLLNADGQLSVTPLTGATSYTITEVKDLALQSCQGQKSGEYQVFKASPIHASLTKTIMDQSISCQGDSIDLTLNLQGEGPWEVVWTNGTLNYTINNISTSTYNFKAYISAGPTITYSLKSVKNPQTECVGTVASGGVTIAVTPPPAKPDLINGSTIVCEGRTQELYSINKVQNAFTYLWESPQGVVPTEGESEVTETSIFFDFEFGAQSGNIRVKAINNCGSSAFSTPLSVQVEPGLKPASQITGNTRVCQGEVEVTYTAIFDKSADLYYWELPPGAGTQSTGGNITTNSNKIIVSYGRTAESGAISVSASNKCTSKTDVTSINIEVIPLPSAGGAITGPTATCINVTGLEFSTESIPEFTSYKWSIPSGMQSSNGNTTTTEPKIRLDALNTPNNYVISVMGQNECGIGEPGPEFEIELIKAPTLTIEGPFEMFAGEEGTFIATADQETTPISWDFGDGNTAVGDEAKHAFATSKDYVISITAENDVKCSSIAEHRIYITNNIPVSIKNIITPNGDGSNDGLIIEGIEDFNVNEVHLYNSMGVEVFNAKNYANNWRAFVKDDAQLSPGNYLCVLVIPTIGYKTQRAITVLK